MTTKRYVRALACSAVAVTLFVAALAAAQPASTFARIDLTDGRSLKDVTVRSYDPASGKVLLMAGRTAMSIPLALIPAPFDTQVKEAVPVAGSNLTTVSHRPTAAPSARAEPVRVVPVQIMAPSTSGERPDASSSLARHRDAASKRAERFFTYEFQAGSSSLSVYDCDIETEEIEAVAGWDGRYRTKGRAYLQFYDSRGRSFSRTTSRFEVLTEQKAGKDVTVVDFTRLGEFR